MMQQNMDNKGGSERQNVQGMRALQRNTGGSSGTPHGVDGHRCKGSRANLTMCRSRRLPVNVENRHDPVGRKRWCHVVTACLTAQYPSSWSPGLILARLLHLLKGPSDHDGVCSELEQVNETEVGAGWLMPHADERLACQGVGLLLKKPHLFWNCHAAGHAEAFV